MLVLSLVGFKTRNKSVFTCKEKLGLKCHFFLQLLTLVSESAVYFTLRSYSCTCSFLHIYLRSYQDLNLRFVQKKKKAPHVYCLETSPQCCLG